jgi:mRNA interferase MazF
MNLHIKTLVVAPMTTTSKAYPTRVVVTHNKKKGWVALDQIRCIDKSRIIKNYKRLTETEISRIKSVLRETYVD